MTFEAQSESFGQLYQMRFWAHFEYIIISLTVNEITFYAICKCTTPPVLNEFLFRKFKKKINLRAKFVVTIEKMNFKKRTSDWRKTKLRLKHLERMMTIGRKKNVEKKTHTN